jgi:hypothetical protein
MVFQNRRQRRTVRFSATVQIREYALAVGDIALCVTTPYCPRMCRSHPLPLTLTDQIVRAYHAKLRETPSAPLAQQTCESQMQRLLQYPGSQEDRMRVLIQLNIDFYEQLLRQSSKPPPLTCLQRLIHGPDAHEIRMRVLIQLNIDFYAQQLQQSTIPALLWDESTLQAKLGYDMTPVRVECLDDDDREAQQIARPIGVRIVQEAIVKAVVTNGGKHPSKMYLHLQNTQSKSKMKARKKALALQGELYGRSGLSVQTNLQEWKGHTDQQQRPNEKEETLENCVPTSGLENILPLRMPNSAMTWA